MKFINAAKRKMYQRRKIAPASPRQIVATANFQTVNLVYTTGVHNRSIEVIIFRRAPIDRVPYDDRKGWPDACELRACHRTADKSQVEKNWRRKSNGSLPPAHMN
jgi:hypothetical protein